MEFLNYIYSEQTAEIIIKIALIACVILRFVTKKDIFIRIILDFIIFKIFFMTFDNLGENALGVTAAVLLFVTLEVISHMLKYTKSVKSEWMKLAYYPVLLWSIYSENLIFQSLFLLGICGINLYLYFFKNNEKEEESYSDPNERKNKEQLSESRKRKIEQFKRLIDDKNNNDTVIGIKGEWGSGKSSFINSWLNEENKKYIKVSLVTVMDREELRAFIIGAFEEVLRKERINPYSLKKYLTFFQQLKGKYNFSDLFSSSSENGYYATVNKISEKISLLGERLYIIVDDIDRIDNSEKLKEIIGILHDIKLFKGIRIIILYDDIILKNILQQENSEQNYLHKFIDRDFELSKLSPNEIIEDFLSEEKYEQLSKIKREIFEVKGSLEMKDVDISEKTLKNIFDYSFSEKIKNYSPYSQENQDIKKIAPEYEKFFNYFSKQKIQHLSSFRTSRKVLDDINEYMKIIPDIAEENEQTRKMRKEIILLSFLKNISDIERTIGDDLPVYISPIEELEKEPFKKEKLYVKLVINKLKEEFQEKNRFQDVEKNMRAIMDFTENNVQIETEFKKIKKIVGEGNIEELKKGKRLYYDVLYLYGQFIQRDESSYKIFKEVRKSYIEMIKNGMLTSRIPVYYIWIFRFYLEGIYENKDSIFKEIYDMLQKESVRLSEKSGILQSLEKLINENFEVNEYLLERVGFRDSIYRKNLEEKIKHIFEKSNSTELKEIKIQTIQEIEELVPKIKSIFYKNIKKYDEIYQEILKTDIDFFMENIEFLTKLKLYFENYEVFYKEISEDEAKVKYEEMRSEPLSKILKFLEHQHIDISFGNKLSEVKYFCHELDKDIRSNKSKTEELKNLTPQERSKLIGYIQEAKEKS